MAPDADALRALVRANSPSPQTLGPEMLEVSDGSVIGAVCAVTDFAAEEEAGVGDLARTIARSRTDLRMRPGAAAKVTCFADANALAISVADLPRAPRWGERLPGASADYAERFVRMLPIARGAETTANRWVSTSELREECRRAGIRPARSRAETLERLDAHLAATRPLRTPECWPSDFRGGRTLILRADEGASAIALEGLRRAATDGTLALRAGRALFASGLCCWDGRDEPAFVRAEREAAARRHDAWMADLAPVEAALRARGHRWFFLGNPQPTTLPDGSTAVRYWLNGWQSPGATGQPYGWYTLEQLRDEQFVADTYARAE